MATIESMRDAAGQAGDFLLVAMCQMDIDGHADPETLALLDDAGRAKLAALSRAQSELGASLMADGRYRYRDDGMGADYAVSADDLAYYIDCLDSDDESVRADAYSHWCAGTQAERLISVGDRVDGGKPGTENDDTGVVRAINGDMAMVAWDGSMHTTLAPISELRAR